MVRRIVVVTVAVFAFGLATIALGMHSADAQVNYPVSTEGSTAPTTEDSTPPTDDSTAPTEDSTASTEGSTAAVTPVPPGETNGPSGGGNFGVQGTESTSLPVVGGNSGALVWVFIAFFAGGAFLVLRGVGMGGAAAVRR